MVDQVQREKYIQALLISYSEMGDDPKVDYNLIQEQFYVYANTKVFRENQKEYSELTKMEFSKMEDQLDTIKKLINDMSDNPKTLAKLVFLT